MRRGLRWFPLAILLLAGVLPAAAQDVLTAGSGSGPAGGSVAIPLYLRDRSGTPLGSDAGAGNRIQGIAVRVTWPASIVSSVTFSRAGVTAAPVPLHQSVFTGTGWLSAVMSFSETSNPIAFTLDAAPPGDSIGTLTVALQASAAVGSIAEIRIGPPFAALSNQAGSVVETIASGGLTIVNGSVTVNSIAAPTGLSATAAASQVNVVWNAVAGAASYEVWRSVASGAYSQVGTPSSAAFTDTMVSAGTTYLYRVRAVDGGGGMSPYSAVEAATMIVFTDDPVVPQATAIKAVHLTELRTAVNAMRAAASLSPLASDPSVAAGSAVLLQHITALRTGLDEARATAGLSALTYTDTSLTSGVTVIKSAHVQELRNGVK